MAKIVKGHNKMKKNKKIIDDNGFISKEQLNLRKLYYLNVEIN